MQTTKEKVAHKAGSKQTCFETPKFCQWKHWKMQSLFMPWCCCAWAVPKLFVQHVKNLNKFAVLTHSLCDTMHMKACPERHAFRKLLCSLSQYGQHSWEELKRSVAPIECSWFYRCLLGKSDSSKVPLYMLHMCDVINLPFSGSTRLAIFVLHSLYLYLSDWKIPSWILWP